MEPGSRPGPIARAVGARPEDIIDVFVYVVVLNLTIEYLPSVISEGFTLSLLTAVLLKVALEVVIVVKAKALARFQVAVSVGSKVVAVLLLWVAAAGSKFAVLWLVDLVFGDAVSLGGFFSVTLLVVSLMLSRSAVRRLLVAGPDPAGDGPPEQGAPSPATSS